MKTTGYCYHSVNVITFGLAQSDHIKRLLLYLQIWSFTEMEKGSDKSAGKGFKEVQI